ncbi:MAG: hypothetical protein IJZ87_07725 [Bacteroidales bacterium]|nr:hypothetical protein [Bacteroidales bacterium]
MRKKFLLMCFVLSLFTSMGGGCLYGQTIVSTETELKNALTAGGDVKLGANLEVTEMIAISAGVTATLDLNSHAITSGYQTGSTTKHIYPLDNYGTLTTIMVRLLLKTAEVMVLSQDVVSMCKLILN